MRDKPKALNLVLELYNNWDIATCIDMVVICKSFLGLSDQINQQQQEQLNQQDEKIKNELNHLNWQEIKEICQNDPATMVRNLLDSKHYDLARKIRDHFSVSDDASLALQTLSELGEESISILDSLLPIISEISVKLFLVQFLLSNMRSRLSKEKLEELTKQEIGYQVLLVLPTDLQQEYSPFINNPLQIIEMLIMNEKIPLVAELLLDIKDLKDVDDLLTYYARKA
ncbi:hypothetical protein ACTA71_005083 [Dictyostelium dimigraforme]